MGVCPYLKIMFHMHHLAKNNYICKNLVDQVVHYDNED